MDNPTNFMKDFFGITCDVKTESNPNFMWEKPCMLLQTLSNSVGNVDGLGGVFVCVCVWVRTCARLNIFSNFNFFLMF